MVLTKKLATKQDFQLFFSQVKAIYFDGKIIANRGCSNQDLRVSNIIFARMKRRQDLLNQARKAYKAFKKQEKQKWSRRKQTMNKKEYRSIERQERPQRHQKERGKT
ncbi:TPA: hypothetical protein ITS83_002346 [Enterococcus faecalis]|nr:hypothetical protein [Enterococcus faecalis]